MKALLSIGLLLISITASAKVATLRKPSSNAGDHLLESMLGKYQGDGCSLEVFEVGDDYRFLITNGTKEVLGKFDRNQVLAAVSKNSAHPEINNKEESEVYWAKLEISHGHLSSVELSHKSFLVFGATATCSNLR